MYIYICIYIKWISDGITSSTHLCFEIAPSVSHPISQPIPGTLPDLSAEAPEPRLTGPP